MRRILVIDDEPSLRLLIRRYLSRRGFRVDLAVNGEEGIRLCQADRYDMIISDCHMPGPQIAGILMELRRLEPSIPILAISGLAQPDEVQRVLKAGATRFLAKPFDLSDLLRTILAMS